jgi:hypothetical protein
MAGVEETQGPPIVRKKPSFSLKNEYLEGVATSPTPVGSVPEKVPVRLESPPKEAEAEEKKPD